MEFQRWSVGVLAAVLLAACVTSPTGRRQLMLVSEDTAIQASREAYLSELGQLELAALIAQMRPYYEAGGKRPVYSFQSAP